MMKPLTKEQLGLLNEHRESGLNKKQFCKQKGIRLHKLDYLIYKQQRISKTETTFFNITEINTDSSVTIDLRELTLTVTNDVDDELLRKIIKAAKS